jgi:TatD DNase family protein
LEGGFHFIYDNIINVNYIDIHSHLDSSDYDADRQEVLARMKEGGVGTITIGADFQSSKKAVEIAEANDDACQNGEAGLVWACIGIHPEGMNYESGIMNYEWEEFEIPPLNIRGGQGVISEEFENLIKSPKVVAIGECGLDYFKLEDDSVKKKQKNLFESQIQFAIKHDKPLMLHIRSSGKNNFDAYNDTLEILNNYKGVRGNVHFFAGDVEIAKKFLNLEFTMSFTGVVTFLPSRSFAKAGTDDYNEVIKYIPQNMIMSETDAPFVAPVPHRGKRNEPVYVIEVVKKLAEIRGEDFESLNSAILQNAKRVFAI